MSGPLPVGRSKTIFPLSPGKAAWDAGINTLGADWLKEYYEPSVYVLGRDDVPQDVLTAPDILVVTDENEGPSLGTSAWAKTGHVHTPCFVRMSMAELVSFTYADMYNVTAQEYGHCLGVKHVGLQGGVDPTSEQKHPEHDVMNGFYTHTIGMPGTHLHCVSNLDIRALEHVFDYKLAYSAVLNLGVEGVTYMPVSAYGDTCAHPPADWREQRGRWDRLHVVRVAGRTFRLAPKGLKFVFDAERTAKRAYYAGRDQQPSSPEGGGAPAAARWIRS